MPIFEYNVAPPQNVTSYEVEVQLDGTSYRLTFRWNSRELRWYMTIKDADGVTLKPSCKLVNNWPMLRKYSMGGLPWGDLFIADQGGDEDPSVESLGRRHKFLYFDAFELENLT